MIHYLCDYILNLFRQLEKKIYGIIESSSIITFIIFNKKRNQIQYNPTLRSHPHFGPFKTITPLLNMSEMSDSITSRGNDPRKRFIREQLIAPDLNFGVPLECETRPPLWNFESRVCSI